MNVQRRTCSVVDDHWRVNDNERVDDNGLFKIDVSQEQRPTRATPHLSLDGEHKLVKLQHAVAVRVGNRKALVDLLILLLRCSTQYKIKIKIRTNRLSSSGVGAVCDDDGVDASASRLNESVDL